MNQKEELAEYIIKNLIFIVLFILFSFYSISYFLLPKFQDYQEKRNNYRHIELLLSKINQENANIQTQIQTATKKNHSSLEILQSGVSDSQIYLIAKEFLESVSINKGRQTTQGIFTETQFEIHAKSNEIRAFFDFIKKIKTAFPNIAFTLPFSIVKNDPFSNTLEVTLILKSTQLEQKKSNKE